MRIHADRATQLKIYGWAFRLLQNHDDALDAVQEVMLRAVRHRAMVVENPMAWLRRVTINLCMDMIRRRRRVEPEGGPELDTRLPEQTSERLELQRAVLAGLEQLSERQRAVLVAKVFDGETFAAIASEMSLSVSSAKTHYVRGLRAMRSVLRPFGETGP